MGDTDGASRHLPWAGRTRAPRPAPTPPSGTVATVEQGGVRWINVERPDAAALATLRARFPFHTLDLEDVREGPQRPKLDEYADYLFLIVQFPVHAKRTRTTTAGAVALFVGRDYVVTLHDATLRPLGRLFDEAERDPAARAALLADGPARLLHRILDRLVDYCVPLARRIDGRIAAIDARLFAPDSLQMVQELALVRRDLIATRRIVRPQAALTVLLEERVPRFFGATDPDLAAYFGDLADHMAALQDQLDEAREVVDALGVAADSLLSHRSNETIKLLTLFSALLLPLTLLVSLYGLVVPPPAAQHRLAFVLLLAAMAGVALGLLRVFRWRRWL